jgi:hypothetical protein
MTDQKKPFVVTDRRKFTLDGQPRLDADPSPEKVRPAVPPTPEKIESNARIVPPATPAPTVAVSPEPPAHPAPTAVLSTAQPTEEQDLPDDLNLPASPTPEQLEQSRVAFETTARRLDIAIRAANPGMEETPEMSFDRLVQSVYMTAIMQLGGGTPQGQKPQVDLLGARQSIDMLTVIAEKTRGNLAGDERRLIESALFELRLAFLEITQTIARSAVNPPGAHSGPSIVR